MDKADTDKASDDLDAFFTAALSENPEDIETAAASFGKRGARKQADAAMDDIDEIIGELDGKFIAYDPESLGRAVTEDGDPLVLIPANVHSYVPWWGWTTIALGLIMLASGIMLMPGIALDRLAARLDDSDQATVQYAMRQLVMRGDERTVKKLYSVAASPEARVVARLRAVDAMSLIERVPEVDRALLRLELTSSTNEQVREAAIAARKQREAVKARRAQ